MPPRYVLAADVCGLALAGVLLWIFSGNPVAMFAAAAVVAAYLLKRLSSSHSN